MESSVISFCQNWSIVSAIYIFQAININQRLNPDTTTGYNLKQWLEEAAQCRLPSIDLSKFNSPVSQSSLQDRLDELYSLLKNNDIPNQKRSIKYLSISNKKLMDDNQINKNTIAFFARLEGSGNIQTNLMIKNVNWRLAAVFSGNPKICFCYIDNQWKNLSCKCMNNNWNGSDTILCYTKDKKLEPISINISNLQNTDCLFCMGNKNAVKNEKKNAGKAINKGNLTANKNSLKEESKIETPQKKKKNNNNCIEGQKKKGSSGNCRISIINNSTKLSVFTKPITCVDFLSKTSESNTRESDISVPQDPAFHDFSCQYSQGDLFPSQGPIFQDFSCQYSEENLCQNQKQSNFDKCFDHQKQIDSLKSKIKQQEKKIEDLELTSKNEARKGEKKEILLNLENSKREINDLKETIDDKERKIKKLEQELECEKSKNKDFSIKEIDSLKKLNEEMNKSDEKSNNPPQSTLWCFKELRRNFLIIENSKESIMIASTMKNPIKMTESCKEINNYDQIKNKNAIFEEEKAVKENLNIYSVPIFQYRKWGLPNIGNSCYMNSLLQILASTNCFVKAVQNISNCPMLEKISILAEQIRNKSTKMQALISSLENFRLEIGKQFPHISSFAQQDCKEIFQIIAASLDEIIPNNNIFSIFVKQNQYCYSCKRETHLLDEYQSFLIIPTTSQGDLKTVVKERVTMEKVYAKKNQLFCENCKGKRKIKIKMVEHKWPEVLVLYFPEESRQVKLDENLDVGECKFLLYGVIKYIGSGMFGHYTAMTKDGKIWNIYNDDKVYKTQFEEEDKYLAFYKRINN